MKLKKIIASLTAAAMVVSLSVTPMSVGAQVAIFDNKVVDMSDVAVLGTNLGTVQWNNDSGNGVVINDLSGYADYADKAYVAVDFTTSGGQFYVADQQDWSKSATWYNNGGTVYEVFTAAMAANGIMINGADANITKVTLVNAAPLTLLHSWSNLGKVQWNNDDGNGVVINDLSSYAVSADSSYLKVDFTTSGGQFYVADQQDWSKSATWYNEGGSALEKVTDGMIANGVMINGADATITKVELYCLDVAATAVDVTPATSSIKMGENVQLTAVKTPSNATSTVIWTSSDDKIATVDSKGLVTGVNEGTATITAAVSDTVKATATVEVLTNKTIITPVVDLPDSLTVYTTDTDAQAKLVKAAAKITGIDKLASADYTVTAVSDGSKGTVTFALTTSGAVKYKASDAAVVSDSCVINFEAWKPTFYDDYTVSGPMTIDVDYNSDASAVSSAITAAIGSQTITMELIASEANHAPLPAKAIEDVMTSIVLPDSYDADSTVSVPVTIGLSNVMNEGDVYYPNYTLGASGEAASSVTVTYTVNIGSDSSKPDPNPNPNPNPDPDPDPKPNPDPEPTPNPVPTGYNGDGTDPTAKYPSNGSTDCAASRYAGGNAYSSARAGYAIRQAASGSEVVIIMESDDIILRRVLELLAQKDNVNATFVYSGYSVTINSDDIDADEVTDIDLSNKGKFLTADELAMFDGAIEVRQLNLSAFKGIAKVQITMTMTGASKGADGTALDRTSEGQFRFISDGSVGDDRTFSFEITEGGKYVVYTGDCDVEVYEDDV